MKKSNGKVSPWLYHLPNALTAVRLLMVPLLLALMLNFPRPDQSQMWWAFAVFSVAAFTDKLDGDIARKYNIITNFGKIADPIADKALVLPALFVVVWNQSGYLPAWMTVTAWVCVILITLREIGISVWRMILVRRGRVVPASPGGKVKTVAQMGFIGLSLIPWNTFLPYSVSIVVNIVAWLLLLTATALALKTGWEYLRA